MAAADYAYVRAKGLHHKIWDENGVIFPPPPGQIPAHMQSMFDRCGPTKTQTYREGTEDEF